MFQDKRKKKKKGKKEKEEVKKPAPPMSAAAKAALQHQQRVLEEQERLRKEREAEELRIKQEEDRLAEEQRKIEEEKARKKKAKQDKIDAQKAAGTYMTKTEKERLRKAQERVESMKKSGAVVIPAVSQQAVDATATTNGGGAAMSGAALYRSNKKKPSAAQQQAAKEDEDEDSSDDEEDDASPNKDIPAAVTTSTPSATAVADEDDAWEKVVATNDDEDDWDTAPLAALDLTARKAALKEQSYMEDRIELDKKLEQEKLKASGIERQRREEETRKKREEEERLREEMEKAEAEAQMRKEQSRRNRIARDEEAKLARSPNNLRSPISCIMGHVDTGKTKLLDKIRHTNVQEGEAGGITQQIGATQFSRETLVTQTASLNTDGFSINIPGLLLIDTPGHEAFANLRSRGSSLCDIAILVIDLMHGLEPQTIESLNMLKRKRTPFIVALNKVDRCYGWKSTSNQPIQQSLAEQDENVRYQFRDLSTRAIVQLMEQGLNAKLYWENDDLAHTVSVVPTSAVTGEGVPDLLKMVITLTQERLTEQLMYHEALQCTVLEVKVIEGLGHTVDVVLVNGTLREGDTIVVSTMDGPVVTNIRALLTPPPNREMRVKSEYIHHPVIKGAIGVKIVATDIGRAIAGTPLLVIEAGDDVEDVKEDCQQDLTAVLKSLQTESRGVMVHASTLGALEALLQFLREECKPPIPVAHINIGPIHKKDIIRASIMHEKHLPEFATILAFDVGIDAEAREQAEELNVRIFFADIIYHLFDQFSAYMRTFHEAKKAAAQAVVVFPVVLKIFPNFIFNKKDPSKPYPFVMFLCKPYVLFLCYVVVIGVEVLEGTLRLNTPLCIPQLGMLDVGRVTRLEINHKEVTTAKKGTQVAIRIVNETNPTITFGRQFDDKSALYSKISRASIDATKEFFAE